jgi:hypothetical protein
MRDSRLTRFAIGYWAFAVILSGCGGAQQSFRAPQITSDLQASAFAVNGAPRISSVSRIVARKNQTITISGRNFGTNQPYFGDSAYLWLYDLNGNWRAGCGPPWGNCGVTINVTAWSDTQIIIRGFGGTYHKWKLNRGDPVLVLVWNAQTGEGPAVFVTRVRRR